MIEPIRVIVVEDKVIVAEDIAERLRKHNLDVVAICADGEDAIAQAQVHEPDLLLMDIQLQGKIDGVTAAEEILKRRQIPVIYLSSFTDKATIERAKATRPANYLTKPFLETDLVRAIDFAIHNARTSQLTSAKVPHNCIFLRVDNQKFVKLKLDDIIYLKASGSYCDVVRADETTILSTSLNHVLEQMSEAQFVRVQRSFAVNMNHVVELNGNALKLTHGPDVVIGQQYKDALLARLKFLR